MNPLQVFRNLPVRVKTMFLIVLVLALLAAGMEGFLLRYMRNVHEQSAEDFARNLARSIALAVRNDFAVGNTFQVDRVFLGIAEERQAMGIVRCVLLDEAGTIAADLNPELFGERFSDRELLPLIRGTREVQLLEQEGQPLVAAAVPVFSDVNRIGTVLLTLSMEQRAREYRFVALLSVFLTCGFILLLGVLMVFLLRSVLLGPLEEISRQAAAVAAGDHNRRIALGRQDEFGKLAEALDFMRSGIVADREKYRILVEGSADIIFTMDEELRFTSGFEVLKQRIAPPRPDFSRLRLPDLIYEHAQDDGWSKAIFAEQVQAFLGGVASARHRVRIRSRTANEPLDFELLLEHIQKAPESRREILGRLSTVGVDRLAPYFRSEKLRFEIENYIAAGDEVALRIVQNLPRLVGEEAVVGIEMGVREMIINAIEHGNLAISFDEKTAAQESGSYLEFIEERRRRAPYNERHVLVESVLDERSFSCRITDEGDGFDHVAMRQKRFSEVNEQMLQHGRGLLLIAGTFDAIVYNEKGNEVTLTRALQGNPGR